MSGPMRPGGRIATEKLEIREVEPGTDRAPHERERSERARHLPVPGRNDSYGYGSATQHPEPVCVPMRVRGIDGEELRGSPFQEMPDLIGGDRMPGGGLAFH